MPNSSKMPNTSVIDDIIKRLEAVEKSLSDKDAEILSLKNSLKSNEEFFTREITKRDDAISELQGQVYSLTDALSLPVANDVVVGVPDLQKPPVVERDTLLIGDSLLRDLDSEIINPGGDTTIKCLPGARPADVVDEFRRISETHSYKRIIVHVGSNLVPKFSESHVSAKVVECMESIKNLSPRSKLAFSQILPKEGDHLINQINRINNQVWRSGTCGPDRTRFGAIPHAKFFCGRWGAVDCDLFARDGVHLSPQGKLQLAKSIHSIMKV